MKETSPIQMRLIWDLRYYNHLCTHEHTRTHCKDEHAQVRVQKYACMQSTHRACKRLSECLGKQRTVIIMSSFSSVLFVNSESRKMGYKYEKWSSTVIHSTSCILQCCTCHHACQLRLLATKYPIIELCNAIFFNCNAQTVSK